MSMWRWLPAAVFMTLAGPAHAVDVYLNNTKVTGSVKSLAMPKVDVRFDDQGNVWVDAPGYKVEVATPPAPPAPPGHYYLVVNVAVTGQYALEIAANGKPAASIPARSPEYLVDLTDKVQGGANTILVTFLPQADAPPVAETNAVDILVGRGEQGADGTLTVTKVLGTLKHKTGGHFAEAVPVQFDLR